VLRAATTRAAQGPIPLLGCDDSTSAQRGPLHARCDRARRIAAARPAAAPERGA
jgi:hypothetical protein